MSGSSLDFIQIITNLDDVTGPGKAIWLAVDAFCIFASLMFAAVALFQIKDVATDHGRTTAKAPIMTLIAAAMFAAAPSAITSIAATIYGDMAVSPLSSIKAGNDTRTVRALLQFISLMGYFFFCRGVWVLRQSGQPEKFPQASGGKAGVILVAAMFAIYIDTTLRFVGNFSGWRVDKYLG